MTERTYCSIHGSTLIFDYNRNISVCYKCNPEYGYLKEHEPVMPCVGIDTNGFYQVIQCDEKGYAILSDQSIEKIVYNLVKALNGM